MFDDRNFYDIFSVSISNKNAQIQRKTYKSRKKHQDRVQDAKKVKKMSIPSQQDVFHRATMEAACLPRK
jgi:hypothetical protein